MNPFRFPVSSKYYLSDRSFKQYHCPILKNNRNSIFIVTVSLNLVLVIMIHSLVKEDVSAAVELMDGN